MHRVLLPLLLTAPAFAADAPDGGPDFDRDVRPVLTKYCAGCHNAAEGSGEFAAHDFGGLMRGGYEGAVVVPGDADGSRLMHLLDGSIEAVMPPEDEPRPTAADIALLRAWIAAGAAGPTGAAAPLEVPRVPVAVETAEPVRALARADDGTTLAVGRYGRVELVDAATGDVTRVLGGVPGAVNAVGFTANGALYAAGGEPGRGGEVVVWSAERLAREDGGEATEPLRLTGHADAVLAAAATPDGTTLVTGSYDRTVRLWNLETGVQTAVLTGHQGPVYGVAVHPALPLAATAGDDATVKLWDVAADTPADDRRLDTLTEPTAAQFAVSFSPDGTHLAAAGADSRVRVWSLTGGGRQGTTPLDRTTFAHEGAILSLVYSADGTRLVTAGDDRTVKLWDAATGAQLAADAGQSDWPAALVPPTDSLPVLVGRMDGTFGPAAPEPAGSAAAAADSRPASSPADAAGGAKNFAEVEPNDTPAAATELPPPAVVTGVLERADDGTPDADLYRFRAAPGERWVIETRAARDGSPADTSVEVLHADGTPVDAVLLRAVLDSELTFRGVDSSGGEPRFTNWTEMGLDDFLYMGGEVMRFERMPRGPDSGFAPYESTTGKRRAYFGTTPLAHALFEPAYVVEPHPPGTPLPANGLPVFRLPFANDDDGDRELGSDSRVDFVAPVDPPRGPDGGDGEYLIRVRDVRGQGGPDYRYTLTVRRPVPGFTATVDLKPKGGLQINAGSGRAFTVSVDRIDGFDGPVGVTVGNLPDGLTVGGPVTIEAGHLRGAGLLRAAADAETVPAERTADVTVTAVADVGGERVTRQSAWPGPLKVAAAPKLTVHLEPDAGSRSVGVADDAPDGLVIAPGSTITARLSIERAGFEGDIKFELGGLPHGVIVDNIGLSGVLVRAGETERQIFLTAADWVEPTTRPVFAVSAGGGDQASAAVPLTVVERP